MSGRHAAAGASTSTRVPVPRGPLGRVGVVAALATAAGAAVAGSTGSLPALGTDSPAITGTDAAGQLAPVAQTAMLATPAAAPATHAAVQPVAMPTTARPAVIRHARTPTPSTQATSGSGGAARHTGGTHHAAAPAGAADATGSIGSRIVAEAAKHRGVPYVWGATGPSAFDCSGFTSYTFRKMGISLPRTAQQQYDVAQHLSRSQAQPGDLIFQGGPDSVYHVAIYAGNGKIWTAPQSGESVKLGNLWGDWSVGRIR